MLRLASLKASAALLAALLAQLAAPHVYAQDRVARETQVVKVVRKLSPAVVYVSCQQRVQNPFAGSFFDMFGGFPGMPGMQGEQEENSLGSGVLVDSAGFVLTNEHVIMGGSKIQVMLNSGKQYPARVVGTAPESDLALLKIDADRTFPTAELGTSEDLMIGESVIAIGNPFGLSNTVTTGILSATGRTVNSGNRRYSDFLQTDAAINPGNSGGALCNILGQVIGINTAIIRDAQGIGFAIPIDRAKRVMEQLRTYGRVRPLWIGVLALDLNEYAKKQTGVSGGFYVARVYPFAHPQAGSLERGDIVTTLNGKAVEGTGDLNAKLAMASAGQRVELGRTAQQEGLLGHHRGHPAARTADAGHGLGAPRPQGVPRPARPGRRRGPEGFPRRSRRSAPRRRRPRGGGPARRHVSGVPHQGAHRPRVHGPRGERGPGRLDLLRHPEPAGRVSP